MKQRVVKIISWSIWIISIAMFVLVSTGIWKPEMWAVSVVAFAAFAVTCGLPFHD